MVHDGEMKKITPEKYDGPMKSEPHYPQFHLKLEDLPEAKDWEIGKNYLLLIGVRMCSIREDEDSSDVGFKVIKVKPLENSSYKKES